MCCRVRAEGVVKGLLLDVREYCDQVRNVPGPRGSASVVGAKRECPIAVVIRLAGEGDLLEVVLTRGPGRGLPHLLDGGHEQSAKDCNNRQNDQQLHEREGGRSTAGWR